MKKVEEVLSNGLLKGYAGGKPKPVKRGKVFVGESSHFEENKSVYYDEWFANQLGGGQELIKSENETYTRLYGGGCPDDAILKRLGINKDQVYDFLKKNLLSLQEKTRLFENCLPEAEGDWDYAYIVDPQDAEDIPIIRSTETISYKHTIVHIHYFILSPVK